MLGLISPDEDQQKPTLLDLLSGCMRPCERSFVDRNTHKVAGHRPEALARHRIRAHISRCPHVRGPDRLREHEDGRARGRRSSALSPATQRATPSASIGLASAGGDSSEHTFVQCEAPGGDRPSGSNGAAVPAARRAGSRLEPGGGRGSGSDVRAFRQELPASVLLLVDASMQVTVTKMNDRVHVLDWVRTISESAPEQMPEGPNVITAYLGMQIVLEPQGVSVHYSGRRAVAEVDLTVKSQRADRDHRSKRSGEDEPPSARSRGTTAASQLSSAGTIRLDGRTSRPPTPESRGSGSRR